MSSTKKTVNFKLSQFIGTDKPTFLGDYNNDMEIIDGALFTASQTAEEAVNDVQNVKSAQTELKAAHEKIKEQVAQLKETADGMTGDVTAAQEAANSAEEKATAAQTAATDVVNAANTASANATKAKQTADGNKTTLDNLSERVTALETTPKVTEVSFFCNAGGGASNNGGIKTSFVKSLVGMTLKSVTFANCTRENINVQNVEGINTIAVGAAPVTVTADKIRGDAFSVGWVGGGSAAANIDVTLTYILNV